MQKAVDDFLESHFNNMYVMGDAFNEVAEDIQTRLEEIDKYKEEIKSKFKFDPLSEG